MSLLSYAVYIINSVYSIGDSVSYLYESISDAYREKSWVFASRNCYPVVTSSQWYVSAIWAELLLSKSKPLIYYPATQNFYHTGNLGKRSLDIVTAEVSSPLGKLYDMSSFLYSVTWYSNPPSIYELVLLFFVHKQVCILTDVLDGYTITVLTSDAEEIVIPLSSPFAKEPFNGFTEYLEYLEGLKVD